MRGGRRVDGPEGMELANSSGRREEVEIPAIWSDQADDDSPPILIRSANFLR